MTTADRCAGRWTTIALGSATLSLGFAFGIQKIRSFDYWWHLRTGQLIAETGSIPIVDSYSYSVTGEPWMDIHWLFQLVLYATHLLAGHSGVVLGKALVAGGVVTLLATIGWRRDRAWITALGLSLMLFVVGDRFMPRPELPSFIFLASVMALLERFERSNDRWIYAIVPVQLLWANMHGLYAIGLAVIAIYAFSEALRPLSTPGAPFWSARLRRITVAATAALAASVMTPHGLEGLMYPIEQLGMIGPLGERAALGSLVAELKPLLGGMYNSLVLGLVATLAALSFGVMALNWKHLSCAHILLWVAFSYLALSAGRNSALLGIVFAPIFVRNLNEFLDRHPLHPRLLQAMSAVVVLAIVGLTIDVARGSMFSRLGTTREPGLGVSEAFFPVGAVDWIARERPPGRIFHYMVDGGYLIWNLYPDYRVISDGRLEVYGYKRFLRLTAKFPETFRPLDAKYHFGVALIHYSLVDSAELLQWFHFNSNWSLVYLDEAAALFARLPPNGRLPWKAIDDAAPDLFATRDPGYAAIDHFQARSRTEWFVALGRFERALQAWEQIDPSHRDDPEAKILHATLLFEAGKSGAAEAVLRDLVNAYPNHMLALSRIGDVRMSMGDAAAARRFYSRALEVNPQFVDAVFGLGVVAKKQGDIETARSFFGQVQMLSSGPSDPLAQEAKRLLEELSTF
jgi:tetratricopeptide (TPR) repeat protein